MNETTFVWNTTAVSDGGITQFISFDDIYKEHLPIIYEIPKHFKVIMYFFGFPGNILAFIMWLRKPLLQSSGCYLAALAISDLLFLVLSMVYDLQYLWEVRTLNVPVICEAFPVVYMAVQYMSPLLTMAFTIERFISIKFPFKRRVWCTVKRAALVIVFLVTFVLMAPGIQAYIWRYDTTKQMCDVRQELDQLRTQWAWVTEATMFILVPVLILVVNVLVIFAIKRSKKRARQLYANMPKHRSATTEMLLVVSFYLIFTTLPVTIVYAMMDVFQPNTEKAITHSTWQNHFRYMIVREVIYDIGMSHYVCNFYLYLATGRRFRIETKRYFQNLLKKNENLI